MTDLVHDRPAAVMREQPTPMELMSQAIAAGVTTGDLERLAALQERHEQRQAERAFGEALARFQSLCPIIKRSKTADTGLPIPTCARLGATGRPAVGARRAGGLCCCGQAGVRGVCTRQTELMQ